MGLVLFLVCLLASGIGSICGIGGGVIIKPVIDMQGIMSVNEASFLSGLTVMAMAMVNIIMRRKTRLLDMRIGSLLALGSVAGGHISIHNRFFTAVKPGLKCPEGYSAPVCSYGTCAHGIGGYTRRACWKRNKQKDIYRDDK